MASDIEIKINLEAPNSLFLRKNEKGIDEVLLRSLEELKDTNKNAPWLTLLEPPKTANQERLMEFAESRRCLVAAIKKINSTHSSKSSQEMHISLSHTKSHSAAFAVLDDNDTLGGIGLDIESKHREIKPEVRAKFMFEFEERLNLSPLELWTIKEASFKAHSNMVGENTGTLFQYEVDEYDPENREGKTVRVQSESESEDDSPAELTSFQIHSYDDLIITIAMTKSVSNHLISVFKSN